MKCSFCAIAAFNAPAREVLRTKDVVAFLPDVPAVLGHTLVVPVEHIRDIWSLDRRTSYALADATRAVASAVAAATGSREMNLIQSNGAAAGQTVFHLHIHVVPRIDGDRMPEMWPPDANWRLKDIEEVQAAIRDAMKPEQPK